MYDFGFYCLFGLMVNWNFLVILFNDKLECMKDEFLGCIFFEVIFIEGLKFKISFNFDLINYNLFDYINFKIGLVVNIGGLLSCENDCIFLWIWNNILIYDKIFGEYYFNLLVG